MRATASQPFEPSPAERARTTLRAAPTLQVCAAGIDWTVDIHGTDATGRPVLTVADRSPLAAALAGAPGPLPTLVHAAHLRTRRGPDRVRARAEVLGWLDVVAPHEHRAAMATLTRCGTRMALAEPPDGLSLLRVDALAVTLDGSPVDPDGYRFAAPDPLVDREAHHLRDLVPDRGHELTRLCRLLDPVLVAGATEIAPSGLDRYGLLIQITRPDGIHETRLLFRPPLRRADALGPAFRRLLATAPPGPLARGITVDRGRRRSLG